MEFASIKLRFLRARVRMRDRPQLPEIDWPRVYVRSDARKVIRFVLRVASLSRISCSLQRHCPLPAELPVRRRWGREEDNRRKGREKETRFNLASNEIPCLRYVRMVARSILSETSPSDSLRERKREKRKKLCRLPVDARLSARG